jgi:hypothetical protein
VTRLGDILPFGKNIVPTYSKKRCHEAAFLSNRYSKVKNFLTAHFSKTISVTLAEVIN